MQYELFSIRQIMNTHAEFSDLKPHIKKLRPYFNEQSCPVGALVELNIDQAVILREVIILSIADKRYRTKGEVDFFNMLLSVFSGLKNFSVFKQNGGADKILKRLIVEAHTKNKDKFVVAIRDDKLDIIPFVFLHMRREDWQRLVSTQDDLIDIASRLKNINEKMALICSWLGCNCHRVERYASITDSFSNMVFALLRPYSQYDFDDDAFLKGVQQLMDNVIALLSFGELIHTLTKKQGNHKKVFRAFISMVSNMKDHPELLQFAFDFLGEDILSKVVVYSDDEQIKKLFNVNRSGVYYARILPFFSLDQLRVVLAEQADRHALLQSYPSNNAAVNAIRKLAHDEGMYLTFNIVIQTASVTDLEPFLKIYELGLQKDAAYYRDPSWHLVHGVVECKVEKIKSLVGIPFDSRLRQLCLKLVVHSMKLNRDGALACFELLIHHGVVDCFAKLGKHGKTLVNYIKDQLRSVPDLLVRAIDVVVVKQDEIRAKSGYVTVHDDIDFTELPPGVSGRFSGDAANAVLTIDKLDTVVITRGTGFALTIEGVERFERLVDYVFRFATGAMLAQDTELARTRSEFDALVHNMRQAIFTSLDLYYYIFSSLEKMAIIVSRCDDNEKVRAWLIRYSSTLRECGGGVDGALSELLANHPLKASSLRVKDEKIRLQSLNSALQTFVTMSEVDAGAMSSIEHSNNINCSRMAAVMGLVVPWHDDPFDGLARLSLSEQRIIVRQAIASSQAMYNTVELLMAEIGSEFSDYYDWEVCSESPLGNAQFKTKVDAVLTLNGLHLSQIFDMESNAVDDGSGAYVTKLKLRPKAEILAAINPGLYEQQELVKRFLTCATISSEKFTLVKAMQGLVSSEKGFVVFVFVLRQFIDGGLKGLNFQMLLEPSATGEGAFLQMLACDPFFGPELIAGVMFNLPGSSDYFHVKAECLLRRCEPKLIDSVITLLMRTPGAICSSLACLIERDESTLIRVDVWRELYHLTRLGFSCYDNSFEQIWRIYSAPECANFYRHYRYKIFHFLPNGRDKVWQQYSHIGLARMAREGLVRDKYCAMIKGQLIRCEDPFIKMYVDTMLNSDARIRADFSYRVGVVLNGSGSGAFFVGAASVSGLEASWHADLEEVGAEDVPYPQVHPLDDSDDERDGSVIESKAEI